MTISQPNLYFKERMGVNMSEETKTAAKLKKLKEIFKDYQTNSNIKDAYVIYLNVIKKTNTLGIALKFDEYIEVKEIWYFEKFLMERFKNFLI